MIFKVCLCTFTFLYINGASAQSLPPRPTPPPPSYAAVNIPVVSISKTKEMTASMQLDAVDAFQRAYAHLNANSDRCSIVRQIFVEKYPDYKWHVAMYKAYSIQSIKSIDIKVDQDSYVLFATKN